MDELIPIEKVIEENVRVKELEELGYIINPYKLDDYLSSFQNKISATPDKKYWEGKRVLITGISGFAGSHLAELLLNMGCEIHGTIRRHAVPMHENIEHLRGRIQLHEADINLAGSIFQWIMARSLTERLHTHYLGQRLRKAPAGMEKQYQMCVFAEQQPQQLVAGLEVI